MAAEITRITGDSPVSVLTGVGPVRVKALAAMGIHTLRDLIYHFPRAYEERFRVISLAAGLDGEKHAFILTVASAPRNVLVKRGMELTKFRAYDESGSVEVVFFNQPYLKGAFAVGDEYRFFGKLNASKKSFQLSSPAYEPLPKDGSELPPYIALYPLSAGITRPFFDKIVKEAMDLILKTLEDPIPYPIRERNRLPALSVALRNLHDPEDGDHMREALRRLMFDEFFHFSLSLALLKKRGDQKTAHAICDTDAAPFLSHFPYELTDAQKRVLSEISADMRGDGGAMALPMSRILIGDVGSGKTVCAAAAMYLAVKNGGQTALLVPTEILARQHYKDLAPIFASLGYETALLLGSTPKKEKERIYQGIQSAEKERIPILIGTHALLSDNVEFSDLSLVVTDEQHRFGVLQRAKIREKGEGCHLLVMSATPIPRTLALTVYGDLDLSRIDEMPRGRQRVDTFVVDESYRTRLNAFIQKEVAAGGQVYIVCPAVEEKTEEIPDEGGEISFGALAAYEASLAASALPPLKSAVAFAKELAETTFPHLRVAFLHGKMKTVEKDKTMQAFAAGEIDILVSTTVIEVGVNVPNACLMIVENAERFGLSQLHQLRGRVGRGSRKSYCVLVSNSRGETARLRLKTMQSTYDGYEIAEQDLALRGPGDFFAENKDEFRQSGGISFRLAHLCEDKAFMETAFSEGRELAKADPTLSLPEHRLLQNEVRRVLEENRSTVS